MTHRERIHTAMRLGRPDRVPVMCQLSSGFIERNAASPPDWKNAESAAEAVLSMRERFGFDGVLAIGMVPDKDKPADAPIKWVNHRGKEIAEIDPDDVAIKTDYSHDMAIQRVIVAEGRIKGFSVHNDIPSPFDAFCFLTNLEHVLAGLMLAPNRCRLIISKYVTQSYALARALIDAGVDALKISSPFAGSSFISRRHYTEFVVPYERELTTLIHAYSPETFVYTHTCGFIGDRLELMVSTGIDGIECMDPPPLGDATLADAKARIGSKVFLKGNMDSVNVLMGATPETLEGYVKAQISDGAGGGGYILSSACSVAPEVDPKIIDLLVPLAEKYGRY